MIHNNVSSAAWFIPEMVLGGGAMLILLLDLVWRRSQRRVGLLTIATLTILGAAALCLALQTQILHALVPNLVGTTGEIGSRSLFNGMIASDGFGTFFKWLFLAAATLTVLIASPARDFPPARIGEFYGLLLAIVVGMFLMTEAVDLVMVYLGIELVSMVSYVLSGFRRGDRRAAEASLKYVIYGGVASGIMLFGMSWLYGLLGTTSLLNIGDKVVEVMSRAGGAGPLGAGATKLVLLLSIVFVLCGIGYKVASVPWHMWCPDVYEGAPTPFTAFLSVGPKAAGFALAIRLLYGGLARPFEVGGLGEVVSNLPWPAIIGVLAAITMTLGNVVALVQTNLKRLLAYSSIAHAGYTLMGLAALSSLGMQSVMLYMLVYLIMNLGAFLVIITVAHTTGSESIFDYRGLGRRHPLAAISFAIFLFSLTGLPPLAGFTGKWYLFVAVLQRAGDAGGGWYVLLAIIGALNTAVSLYYYVRIVRAMFLEEPFTEQPVRSPAGYNVMLCGLSAAVLLFGIWWSPIVQWTKQSLVLLRG